MRRAKIFGMVAVPLDRNMKAKLLFRARAMMRPVEKGAHYGAVSAKAYAVLCALLIGFHNAKSGRCFPSYRAISEAASCCERTVAAALAALEECGLLTVCNRLVRVRWKDELSLAWRTRVCRTSNCYTFPGGAAQSSYGNLPRGTGNQVSNPDLSDALDRLQAAQQCAQAQGSFQPLHYPSTMTV
jgi:Helix-turn-helix domain